MKKFKLQTSRILKAVLIIVLVAFISSCESWIDPEINVDPTAPDDVPMSLLIPTIQQDMGYNLMGNDIVRPTNIWMQMFDGVARQSFTQARYQMTAADINNLWNSIYSTQLMNAKILIEKAEEQQSPYNAAVGQILTATILGFTTDVWGDIPYSDALNGSENVLKAVFDTQEQVYASIHSLLDQAIVNLSVAPVDNLIPIEGDVFYGGDTDLWMMAAYSIKARHTLQLSKRNGNAAYTDALALIDDGFTHRSENMTCPFAVTNKNPIYQFMDQRGGDLVMCSTLFNEMDATGDPRVAYYFGADADDGISGSDPGSENGRASVPGSHIAADVASTHLMTFAELKFIEAEAAFQTNDKARAVEAYIAGTTSSIYLVTHALNDAWLDGNIRNEAEGTITLEKIIMQKRHALVGQLQPFSDWRRTGIPSLALTPGATKTAIPQRFPYAQDEVIYNEANVPSIGSITDPVWWSQ